MHWFISDTHFRHANIIRYCNRPFRTVGEMDVTILNNINRLVAPDDTLWHIGDFAYGRGATRESITLARTQILCKDIRLIVGNHDGVILADKSLKSMFTTVLNYYLGEINGHKFLMTHRPPWNLPNANGSWNWEKTLWDSELAKDDKLICLHGHTHNNSDIGPRNMCVEVLGYKPISFPDLLARFN